MIEIKNKEGKEVKKRTSKTNQEYLINKSLAVKEKLENPDITTRELEKKYNVSRSVVALEINKEIKDIKDTKNNIIDKAKENVEKWVEIIRKRFESIKDSDLKTQSDINLFTSSLKNQISLVNMLENYWNNNDNKHIIPLNIQINIKEK